MPQPPEDLSNAIAHCEAQLKRLGLRKTSAVILLWLHMSGYMRWEVLDLNGFRDLYKFLKECEPCSNPLPPTP
jgi:hypothetical protein